MRNISLKLSRDEMRNCPGCQPYCDPSILAGLSDLRNMLHSRVLPQKGSFALLDHIPLTHQLTPIRLSDSGFIVTLASCPSAACCTSPGEPLLAVGWGPRHAVERAADVYVGWSRQCKITPALSLYPSHRSPGNSGYPSTVSAIAALPTPSLPGLTGPGMLVSQDW